MPEYTYMDKNGHTKKIIHRMLYSTGIACEICGAGMWRKPPTRVAVNWNGLAPSAGGTDQMHPEIANLYKDTERKREEHFRSKSDGSYADPRVQDQN